MNTRFASAFKGDYKRGVQEGNYSTKLPPSPDIHTYQYDSFFRFEIGTKRLTDFDKGLLFYFMHRVNESGGSVLATKVSSIFNIGLQYTSNNSTVILLIKLSGAQLLFA